MKRRHFAISNKEPNNQIITMCNKCRDTTIFVIVVTFIFLGIAVPLLVYGILAKLKVNELLSKPGVDNDNLQYYENTAQGFQIGATFAFGCLMLFYIFVGLTLYMRKLNKQIIKPDKKSAIGISSGISIGGFQTTVRRPSELVDTSGGISKAPRRPSESIEHSSCAHCF